MAKEYSIMIMAMPITTASGKMTKNMVMVY